MHAEENIKTLEERLHPREELERLLSELLSHPDSLAQAVHLDFHRGQDVVEQLGEADSRPESASISERIDEADTECRVRVWSRQVVGGQQQVDVATLLDIVQRLARAYWQPNSRDRLTGLWGLQLGVTLKLLTPTLNLWARKGKFVTCLFADLDHFKRVNDVYGEGKGDEVIQKFATVLNQVLPRTGIALRRSGDEFLLYMPCGSAAEPIAIARRLAAAVAEYDFEIGELTLGVSVGIGLATRFDEAITPASLEREAELGMKPNGEEKQRGRARFGGSKARFASAPLTGSAEHIVRIRLRASAEPSVALPSPWLQLISHASASIAGDVGFGDAFDRNITELIDWIGPVRTSAGTRIGIPQDRLDLSSNLSALDMVAAAAHGAYSASAKGQLELPEGSGLSITYSPDGGSARLLLTPSSRTLICANGTDDEQTQVLELGAFPSSSGDEALTLSRLPILLVIGYDHFTDLPRDLFDAVVFLDTRPLKSGGLPDFWAGAVAEVLTAAYRNPNSIGVYLLGETRSAPLTVGKLRAIAREEADIPSLAEKTGLRVATIRESVERLRQRVHEAEKLEDLLRMVGEALATHHHFIARAAGSKGPEPTLERELSSASLTLTREDGCRVDTAQEAFPIVLEIARNAQQPIIQDQVGRKIRELIDFKVVLRDPLSCPIPAFYDTSEETLSLQEYFEKEFLTAGGLFRRAMAQNHQQRIVIEHVAATIMAGQHFATRRAILVIPHEVDQTQASPTPLGLVSVRIIPRFTVDATKLAYSFTWRTVEALVGFPFSLYGSIQCAYHLTEQVKAKVSPEVAPKISVGELSYVAHSLHMFVDDYGQAIARKIVNDATR